MNNLLKYKILISLLLVASQITLSADVNQQVIECGQIKSNIERLECYDNISPDLNSIASNSNPNTNEVAAVQNIESKPVVVNSEVSVKNNPAHLKTLKQTQDNKIANFGLPAERTKDDLQIKAHLLGDIKRWDENSVFKLDNGQIWRAVRSNAKRRRSPIVLSNPEVTITRAVLGTYDLRMQGMRGKLKVKRLK